AWHFEFFLPDIFPDVQFSPIAQRKDPHLFAGINPGIVQVPNLGTLIFGVPLAETVAEREEPFFGARLFFVTPRPADATIKTKLLDSRQQGRNLQPVPAGLTGRGHSD